MKAVIYTRVSTNKQNEVSHETQEEKCRLLAKRHGFKVSHVYTDHAKSGTTKHRPEYQAMLADAKARKFNALLIYDLSRFGRGLVEQERSIDSLVYHGIVVLTEYEHYDSRIRGGKLQRQMHGAMNEGLIEVISVKTHEGQDAAIRKGRSAGGRAYGYRTEPIHNARGEKVGAKPYIHEAEAKIVREIFKLYAGGWSPRRIANELNRRKLPSPGAGWKRETRRKDGKWLASTIYGDPKRGSGILNNRIYEGVRLWNRSRRDKNPETDHKVFKRRTAAEYVTVPMPHLRIVPEALWRQVRARQQRQSESLGVRVKGGLKGKKRTGRQPKYLLSGILRCGECGASAVVSGAYQLYVCASHTNSGEHACANGLRVKREVVERRVIEELRADLSDPAVFKEFERETRRVLRERREAGSVDQKARARRISELENVIGNLTDAISTGGLSSTALATRLTDAEAELATLSFEAEPALKLTGRVTAELPQALGRYQALLKELNAALAKDVDRARGLLQEYFEDGVVRLEPNKKRAALDAVYRIDGRRLVKSLTGQVTIRMVAGAGFEPATFGL